MILKMLDRLALYLATPDRVLHMKHSLDLLHHFLAFAGNDAHHDRKLKLHLHSDSIHNLSLPCCHCGSHV